MEIARPGPEHCGGSRWALLLAVVGLAAVINGCQSPETREQRRFAPLSLTPCPLFLDDVVNPAGLPACPFAEESSAHPCLIEHFIDGDPKPRSRRRLKFDEQGRLESLSDERNGEVVESRKIYYEQGAGTRTVNHYDVACGEMTPTFLYSMAERYDGEGRLIAIDSGAYHASIDYRFVPSWLADQATVAVSGSAGDKLLHVDPQGYLTDAEQRGQVLRREVEARNGKLLSVRWYGADSELSSEAHYSYTDGRLSQLRFTFPNERGQTYRFSYQCDQEPLCVSHGYRRRGHDLLKKTALSRDPDLSSFVARNCSDQLTHGPRICGAVMPEGFASARCCKSSPEQLEIELRTPLAGDAVHQLRLRLADGSAIESAPCRGEPYHSVCGFERERLLQLPSGPLTIELCNQAGHIIDLVEGLGQPIREAAR